MKLKNRFLILNVPPHTLKRKYTTYIGAFKSKAGTYLGQVLTGLPAKLYLETTRIFYFKIPHPNLPELRVLLKKEKVLYYKTNRDCFCDMLLYYNNNNNYDCSPLWNIAIWETPAISRYVDNIKIIMFLSKYQMFYRFQEFFD